MEDKENVKNTEVKAVKKDFKKGIKKPFKKTPTKTLDEVVLETKAVVKVTKGGRQRRFQAVVLVGDKKGQVGLGTGKANEVSEAVKKARQEATKNIVKISIVDGRTIPHEVVVEWHKNDNLARFKAIRSDTGEELRDCPVPETDPSKLKFNESNMTVKGEFDEIYKLEIV